MSKASVAVLGGDLRQHYLAEYMVKTGHEVTCFGVMPIPISDDGPSPSECSPPGDCSFSKAASLREAVSDCAWILGPMPFSRDGERLYAAPMEPAGIMPTEPAGIMPTEPAGIMPEKPAGIALVELADVLRPGQTLVGGGIPERFSAACAGKQVMVIDLMEDEALIRANSALTAEGLLSMLIAQTPFSLTDRRFLILGFGRCGQEIAWLLSSFSAALTAYDHDPKRISLATLQGFSTDLSPDYDVIINTIPAQVLTVQQLVQLPAHCMLFDIASAPFGFDPKTARELGLALIRCPGIPGAMMPQTAGELIGKSISERMLSHGF